MAGRPPLGGCSERPRERGSARDRRSVPGPRAATGFLTRSSRPLADRRGWRARGGVRGSREAGDQGDGGRNEGEGAPPTPRAPRPRSARAARSRAGGVVREATDEGHGRSEPAGGRTARASRRPVPRTSCSGAVVGPAWDVPTVPLARRPSRARPARGVQPGARTGSGSIAPATGPYRSTSRVIFHRQTLGSASVGPITAAVRVSPGAVHRLAPGAPTVRSAPTTEPRCARRGRAPHECARPRASAGRTVPWPS